MDTLPSKSFARARRFSLCVLSVLTNFVSSNSGYSNSLAPLTLTDRHRVNKKQIWAGGTRLFHHMLHTRPTFRQPWPLEAKTEQLWPQWSCLGNPNFERRKTTIMTIGVCFGNPDFDSNANELISACLIRLLGKGINFVTPFYREIMWVAHLFQLNLKLWLPSAAILMHPCQKSAYSTVTDTTVMVWTSAE